MTTIIITYPGVRQEMIRAEGLGILHLNSRCSARQGHVTITSSKTLGYTEDFVYMPHITLDIKGIDPLLHEKIQTIRDPRSLTNEHTNTDSNFDFDLSLHDIPRKYDTIITEREQQRLHQYKVYGFTGANLLFVICLIGAVLYCTFRLKKSRRIEIITNSNPETQSTIPSNVNNISP